MRSVLFSGNLRSLGRYLVTDVKGKYVGPIFNGQAAQVKLDCLNLVVGTDRLSRKVSHELPFYASTEENKSLEITNLLVADYLL